VWLSGGGQSFPAESLGARWLGLAGFRQRALPAGRLTLEAMITSPPKVLIISDYRSRQMSAGQRWLNNQIVRRARIRKVVTDGRPWTCMGPLMIPEIERLRAAHP
jgi:iron complex transport system substrate-binding protein